MQSREIYGARLVCGIHVIGPDLFAVDAAGRLLTPIASVFPSYRLLVTVQGIHATQAEVASAFFRQMIFFTEHRLVTQQEEDLVYQDAVSLFVRDGLVLVRSEPGDMDRVFAADQVLQLLVPKRSIQFTGTRLAEVRKRLRSCGESWRIALAPRSVEEMTRYIESSRVRVGTGTSYYQSAATGERFLTYEEFMHIREMLGRDRTGALARLHEILVLSTLYNRQGVHELSFFTQEEGALPTGMLHELNKVMACASSNRGLGEQAEELFDRFAASFREAAGISLICDSLTDPLWRTVMFCRLFGIDWKAMEEWSLGLSPEFHLNVTWLPGGRIVEGGAAFEPEATFRVRSLILHYRERRPGLVSINLGRVESSQTIRDRSGEGREVYLAALGLADGSEEIRLIRMMKWDVMHHLGKGAPLPRAIAETEQYRQYIFDRLRGFACLGIPLPDLTEVRLWEDLPGLGAIPVFFFDRPYIEGLVTEKIPAQRYGLPGFVVRLAGLLGMAAAVSLVMGRACPRDGHLFFDDGDEVIQFAPDGLPVRLIVAETTGSFNDWNTPVVAKLPQCTSHLLRHLVTAESRGTPRVELSAAIDAFSEHLVREIVRMQALLRDEGLRLRSLYADRSGEEGSVRYKWDKLLDRLQVTDPDEVHRALRSDALLAPYL